MKGKNHKLISFVFCLLFIVSVSAQEKEKGKPKVYAVSNAHFDSQWNWDVQTSIKEYVRNTVYQNLFLLKQYPNYIFNFEGGIKYQWMKEYYPEAYEQVKFYVKEGRWHLTGSTWDATDVNIPSIESFTRNILYGQMFFEDEFGKRSTDMFLPDCFGFGFTLPTVANHCGLIGFSTQKLQWRNNPFYGKSKIPYEIGLWEGVDGARIMLVADAHNYTTKWRNEDLSENKNLKRLTDSSPIHTIYHYYGTGDVGGSPTIETVQSVEKGLKGTGPVEIVSATSDQLYKDYLPFDKHAELPVYKGELLMDVHGTGCYTSQSAMKLYNRKNELLADAAERAAVMADWLGVQAYPQEVLTESWKRFLWHQFHDDLTGTSIPRAYEFSWNDELLSQKQFAQVLLASVGSIASVLNTDVKGIPLVINNPVASAVKDVVKVTVDMPKGAKSLVIYNEKKEKVPSQMVAVNEGKATVLIAADVPPVSMVVYDIRTGSSQYPTSLKVTSNMIENSVYKVTLNAHGDVSSIIDKRNNKELVKANKAIRLALFTENESFSWPAWEILKKEIDKDPVSITDDVKITIAENGPVRASICVERKYKESTFKQYITLNSVGQEDRIDFLNEVDWHTANALLKAEFPLAIENEFATYDLGIGNIKRGNNTTTAYEVPAQYWADLTHVDDSYGVSVMNDSRYGWDKPDNNTIRLTLLHTPKTKGNYAYQDKQDMGYHVFTYSLVGHEGTYTDAGTVEKAEILNQPLKAFVAGKHKGTSGNSLSLAQINSSQIVLKAIKKAEKSGGYVVRVHETTGKEATNMEISFAGDIQEAKELNGVEDVIGDVTVRGNKLTFNAGPFAMKTFLVKLKPGTAKAIQPLSLPVALQYNAKSATYNAFEKDANFDGRGYSYAAELLPDSINANGICFELGKADTRNVVKCEGDTIMLPQNGQYNKLYFLAASTMGNQQATFVVDGAPYEMMIPYYSGFVGQWEHVGHTRGFLKTQEVAYIGTHKHTMMGSKDVPYVFTYMFKFGIDIPRNAKMLILPKNARIALFALTLSENYTDNITSAQDLIVSSLKTNEQETESFSRANILKGKRSVGSSGEANRREAPEFAIDDNYETKWCDISINAPKFIEFDLDTIQTIKGWMVVHAGMESLSYITKEYALEVRNSPNEPWVAVDKVMNNTENETDRLLSDPVKARYVRLTITKPDQDEGKDARILELEVY